MDFPIPEAALATTFGIWGAIALLKRSQLAAGHRFEKLIYPCVALVLGVLAGLFAITATRPGEAIALGIGAAGVAALTQGLIRGVQTSKETD